MVVVTHDLDFGALLAASQDEGPSVIQFRTQDVLSTKALARTRTADWLSQVIATLRHWVARHGNLLTGLTADQLFYAR